MEGKSKKQISVNQFVHNFVSTKKRGDVLRLDVCVPVCVWACAGGGRGEAGSVLDARGGVKGAAEAWVL